MRIRNPLLLNDWEISNTLRVVAFIQAAVLVFSGLAYVGLRVPIIQAPIAFVYLTFVPGILLLRVLKLHKLGNVRTSLYSMGLSLSLLMAVGTLMNATLPRVGVANPISFISLAVVLTLLVLVLGALSYLRDKEFSSPVYETISLDAVPPHVLLLGLLPFITIFATFLMNYYGVNLLQMVLLSIVMAIPFVVTVGWVPQRHYTFLLFIVSFSLLFHTALLSHYAWGSDISMEIALSNSVLQNGVWNITYASNYDAMLSLVILAPIYSLFSGLSALLVFKLLYPFIFTFVPLGLFVAYKRQVGEKIALFSCLFFITFTAFFITMPVVGRQEIAELFLVLIVLLVVEDYPKGSDRALLMLIFGAALATSHYGTSYVFLIISAVALLIAYLVFPKVASVFKTDSTNHKRDISVFVAFLAIFAVSWYMYVSPYSGPFSTVVRMGNAITSSVTEMYAPTNNQPVAYLTNQLVPLQTIERDILLFSLFLILVGLIAVGLERKRTAFSTEFLGWAYGSGVFLALAIVLPYVAQSLQTDRIITLSFIFLAPFCIIGLVRLFGLLSSSLERATKWGGLHGLNKNAPYVAVSVFLAIWIIFNSALIYQLADQPKVGRFALDTSVDFLRFNGREVATVKWIDNHVRGDTVYADVNKAFLMKGVVGIDPPMTIKEITSDQTTDGQFGRSFVLLGSYDLESNQMLIRTSFSSTAYVPTSEIPPSGVILDNGGSKVVFVNQRERL